MKSSELKKGDFVLLRSGWRAELMDDCRGEYANTPCCQVWGMFTEAGSVYTHDMLYKIEEWNSEMPSTGRFVQPTGADENGSIWLVTNDIELSDEQIELQKMVGGVV